MRKSGLSDVVEGFISAKKKGLVWRPTFTQKIGVSSHHFFNPVDGRYDEKLGDMMNNSEAASFGEFFAYAFDNPIRLAMGIYAASILGFGAARRNANCIRH
jgi:hypothetical protein